jgi:serine protease
VLPGDLAGSVVFVPNGTGGVLEAEPNDAIDQSHHLGPILAGQTLVVQGHTTVDGSDPVDGFRLIAPERVRLTMTLSFPDDGINDFDLAIVEHVSFQLVEIYVAASSPEVGVAHVKGSFDLLVGAYAGSGDYVLTLVAEPPGDQILEDEPNAAFADGQYLGEVAVGDLLFVKGTAEQGVDDFDVVYVACPADVQLYLSLSMTNPGDDFDLSVWDGTSDLTAPVLQHVFDAPDNPETGLVDAQGGTLLAVSVDVWSGAGPWTLQVLGLPPVLATPKPGAEAMRAVAPAGRELARRRPGSAPHEYLRPRYELIPGEALVCFEEGAPGGGAQEAARARAFRPGPHAATGVSRLELALPEGLSPLEACRTTCARIAALSAQPGVRYAEPNGVLRPLAEPNDPYYNLQWHYPMLRLPEAWDVTTGSASVVVAVLDTGRTNHPDLVANQVGGYDFISDPAKARDGDGRDPDPTDMGDDPSGGSSFHGTHVAGTIGAAGHNGVGVAGVCWNVQIMHVRVLGVQGGTWADVAEGIRYAAGLPNASGQLPATSARVINMSLGSYGTSQTLQDAVSAARAAGAVLFAAAGNDDTNEPSIPASLAGVVSVAAVETRRLKAPYSNFGPSVDLACPGGDTGADRNGDGYADGVLSTIADDTEAPLVHGYLFNHGTSMACPHAAGVAALMLSVNPTLTPPQIEAIMQSTAEDLGAAGRDDLYGHGLVNALRCVREAQGSVVVSPLLALTPQALSLGATETSADVLVGNVGAGLLQLFAPSTFTPYGGPWLAATLTGSADATRSASGVHVSVDRTGLADGFYAGRVIVPSDGGTREVQVLMEVRSSAPVPLSIDLYVLVVDPATGETVEQAIVNPALGLGFAFDDLPAGDYLLYAGSDLDQDGYICDEAEYCGIWPVSGDPRPVTVPSGGSLSGLDLVVSYRPPLGASAAGAAEGAPCAPVPAGARKRIGCR